MPHARVRSIDTSAALAMPGVKAILTADDLPDLGRRRTRAHQRAALRGRADSRGRRGGRADGRRSDRDASTSTSSRCRSSSIRSRACGPDGPNARLDGNVWGAPLPGGAGPGRARAAVEDASSGPREDFADAGDGRLPMGKAPEEWSYGDLDAGFKDAALVLDETFVVQSTGHHPMETRSAMAYWQNGKLYLHGSTQSVAADAWPASRAGSASTRRRRRPDLRVHRRRLRQQGRRRRVDGDSGAAVEEGQRAGDDAHQPRGGELHRPRAHQHDRAARKVGFAKDGRITALDLFIVQDNGSYGPMGDHRSAGHAASLIYQPPAMRWRAVNVLTNTPPRIAAAIARPDAGQRHHGADHHEGGQAARHRSGRDPPHQLARGQGALRPAGAERPAPARHERVREGGARSRRASCSTGTSARRARASGADRRCAASASPSARTARDRSASTA